MFARGVGVSYETIRAWCAKFGQAYANQLRRRRPRPGDKWHLDEVFVRINGTIHYLWRAVDQHGNVFDVLVKSRRNALAAKQFFRKLLKGLRYAPRVLVTDKLASYQVAHRESCRRWPHRRSKYLNNRAENSHQPTRQRERAMKRFKSPGTRNGSCRRSAASRHIFGPVGTCCRRPTTDSDGRPLRGLERDHRGGHDRRLNVSWDRSFHQNRRKTGNDRPESPSPPINLTVPAGASRRWVSTTWVWAPPNGYSRVSTPNARTSTSMTSRPRPSRSSTTITDAPHQKRGDSTQPVSGLTGMAHTCARRTISQRTRKCGAYKRTSRNNQMSRSASTSMPTRATPTG